MDMKMEIKNKSLQVMGWNGNGDGHESENGKI